MKQATLVLVVEEEQRPPLRDATRPEFAHSVQVPAVEGVVERLRMADRSPAAFEASAPGLYASMPRCLKSLRVVEKAVGPQSSSPDAFWLWCICAV